MKKTKSTPIVRGLALLPKTSSAGLEKPRKPAMSRSQLICRELDKSGKRVWRRLQNEIGVGLFMDILDYAVFVMLDSGISRSTAFESDGSLTEAASAFVQGACDELISPDCFREWSNADDLAILLIDSVNGEVFDYFAARFEMHKQKRRFP